MRADPSVTLLRANPSYRHYWLGQTISSAGSQVAVVAIPLLTALTLQAGPRDVGLVAAAATLPYLLLSLVAGHLLQGKDQRRLMIASDLARALLLGFIPVAWWLDWLTIPLLIAVSFAAGVFSLIFGVSAFSYVPELVKPPQLPAANRATQGANTVNEIAGPGFAGLLITALGPPAAIAIDAASFLASAVGVARSRPRFDTTVKRHTDTYEETSTIWSGLRLLFSTPPLRALTMHAALYNAAEQIVMLNLIIWAVKQREVSAGAYGLALTAGGAGGLIGTLIALRLADKLGLGRAFAVSLVLSCAAPVLLSLPTTSGMTFAVVIAAILFVRGIGEGNANIYSLTMRQQLIPSGQLTRSAGAYTQVMYGSIPIGAVLAGVIGETWGPRTGILIGAIGLVISALPMLTPTFLRLKNLNTPNGEPPSGT